MRVFCASLGVLLLLSQEGVSAQEGYCAPTCEGVAEGAKVKDPSDCRSFYTCVDEDGNGNLVPSSHQQCPDGFYFNETISIIGCISISVAPEGTCEGYCNPCETHCGGTGTLQPHPTNCSLFYVCLEDDASLLTECSDPALNYFDFVKGDCGADSLKCFSYCDECKAYCLEEGLIADPADCHSYFWCDPPTTSHHTCPDELVFDPITQDCVVGICEILSRCNV